MARAHALLIGIGNRLRGDDGVGYRIAERLREERSGLRVLAVQQLTPELAEPIAAARAVLFVDACLRPGRPEPLAIARLHLGDGATDSRPLSRPFSHHAHPQHLLQLSQALYGHCPPAWQLQIPARQLALGETLSADTSAAMEAALALLRRWRPADA